MSITGLECHPGVNSGDFVLQESAVGGKPCWGNGALFLYSINEPHNGYAIGPNGPGLPEGMGWQHAQVVVSGAGWVIRPRTVDPKKGVFQVSGIPEGPLHIEVTMERWASGSEGVAPRRVGPRFRGSADLPLSSELVLDLTEE